MKRAVLQTNLFRDTEAGRSQSGGLTLKDAIARSIESLKFAEDYDTWLVGYSGGKDSTATVALIDWAISTGQIKRPKNLILNNNDTLMELPPLAIAAANFMDDMKRRGWQVFKTEPRLRYKTKKGAITSGRFFVQLLGVGYPPPNSSFTWCRQRMKLDPLKDIATLIRQEYGDSIVTIDGVRIGESVVRDKAIFASCRKDDGECGSTLVREVATGLKLSPVAHWRVCHVADWLMQAEFEHGYKTMPCLEIYGADITDGLEDLSARTGCFGCPLVTASDDRKARPDKALLRVLKLPQWSHLKPLLELGDIYWQLHFDYENRHIWDANQKGNPKRHGRPGCLTLSARKSALAQILEIEERVNREALRLGRSLIQIIRPEELELIQQLHEMGAHPEGWEASDPIGGDQLEPVIVNGQLLIPGLKICS